MMRPLPVKTLLLTIIFSAVTFQATIPQAVHQAKPVTPPDSQVLVASGEATISNLNARSGNSAVITEKASTVVADKNLLTGNCRVYPVPALNELTVSGIENVTQLEVFDVTGNRIISEKCEGIEIKTFNISHLARGVYFIRLTTPLGAVMKRFVKE